jgi:hypothetical protein
MHDIRLFVQILVSSKRDEGGSLKRSVGDGFPPTIPKAYGFEAATLS